MDERNCAHCGAEYSPQSGVGPVPKYCSERCRIARNRAVQKAKYVPRVKDRSTVHFPVCETCERCFCARRKDMKYCSQPCRSRADAERQRLDGRRALQRRRHADKRRVWLEGYYATEAGRAARRRSYEKDREPARLRAARANPPLPERVKLARRKVRRAARGTSGKGNRWVQGNCHRCSTPFLALSNGPWIAAYCSDRCSSAHSNERRRARERNAFVEHVNRTKIFDRDGWRCQLCGKPTKRGAVVPHHDAAVLDHILPLVHGGTHEPANVQCAHFSCNSRKGAGGVDQLRLIG